MTTANYFEKLITELKPTQFDDMHKSAGKIAQKLNSHYYDLQGDGLSHLKIVGSAGRGTCIKGASDLDLIFDLPKEKFTQYDRYDKKSNGQSALLQEVKKVLMEKYPRTDIGGDGQVVVIAFEKYTIELVPGFKQSDNSFKYPDSNNGGSWKITNPLPEINKSKTIAYESNNVFIHICNMLRGWKNNIGFKFGGLLIDTLAYDFLEKNTDYKCASFRNYLDMMKDAFSYLKDLNEEQNYWYALGSNQKVYNSTNGNFIRKAKNAFKKINSINSSENNCIDILVDIFGYRPPEITLLMESNEYLNKERQTEVFISQLFSVDIRYSLKIDCTVKDLPDHNDHCKFKQSLRYMIAHDIKLHTNKRLIFKIMACDLSKWKESCDIYWKVKNNGQEAYKRDCFRGEIIKTNSAEHFEITTFSGAHYVECFLIKNGVCVARDRIDVKIE